ncbi:MAG: sensor histidine kinase [Bacteroidales bacterium]|nr:sensor histidine kinase [Bacteroidales bacterium]
MTLYAFFTLVVFLLYTQAVVYIVLNLKPSTTNRLLALTLASLAWLSLMYFVIQLKDDVSAVYLFDRIAVPAWIAFPWLITLFFYHVSKARYRWLRYFLYVVLPALGVALLIRYLAEPHTLKYFYQDSGLWYFTTGKRSVWIVLAFTYNLICAGLGGGIALRWLLKIRNSKYKKEQLAFKVLLVSFLLLFMVSLLSHLMLPAIGSSALPSMQHIAALPLMAGLFFTFVVFYPKLFFREIIADIFLKKVNEFVFLVDYNGSIYWANQFCLNTLGYSMTELTAIDPETFVKSERSFKELLQKTEKHTRTAPERCTLMSGSGEEISVLLHVVKTEDAFSNMTGFIMIASDYRSTLKLLKERNERLLIENKLEKIYNGLEKRIELRRAELMMVGERVMLEHKKQKQAESKMLKELRLKEEIVREIHHRVKNNFQIIISLINMEQEQLDLHSQARKFYGSIAGRVREIAFIHDYLYNSPYMGKINIGQFIAKATDKLRADHSNKENIQVRVALAEELLSIDKAIPSSIIVYELLKNTIKHAFPVHFLTKQPEGFVPVVHLDLYRNEGFLTIIVGDNGVGLQDMNQRSAGKNIGLYLVELLVQHYLKGDIHYAVHHGTKVTIRFSAENKTKGED